MGKSNLNLPRLVTSYQSPTIPTMDPPRYLRAKHLKPRKPISAKALATGRNGYQGITANHNDLTLRPWPNTTWGSNGSYHDLNHPIFVVFFFGGGVECNIWNMSIENCSLHESFMEMLSHTWRKSYHCAWKTRAIWQKMRLKHSEIENGGGLAKGYQYLHFSNL